MFPKLYFSVKKCLEMLIITFMTVKYTTADPVLIILSVNITLKRDF